MKQTLNNSSSTNLTYAGVDTHKDEHTYAVVDEQGHVLGTRPFPANGIGYAEALSWVQSFGVTQVWGVESVGSYGAGITQVLKATGETIRPIKYPTRFLKGTMDKTDAHDAISAARAVALDYPIVIAGLKDPKLEVTNLSWALSEREHYVKTAKDSNQRLKSMLVNAPSEIRDSIRGLNTRAMLRKVASWRPGEGTDLTDVFKRRARSLARSTLDAYAEAGRVEDEIRGLVQVLCPSLLGITGIGPIGAAVILVSIGWGGPENVPSEGQLASFSGAAPIPVSSGKTDRHRLNRGGNRQLNSVLHRTVLSQRRFDPKVKVWFEMKEAQPGKTKKDAVRCSKRYLVRVIRRALLNLFGDPVMAT